MKATTAEKAARPSYWSPRSCATLAVALLVVNLALAWSLHHSGIAPRASSPLQSCAFFEVIVVGSEPEAVAAAVAAAEAGARTLLLSLDDRVGGLFVLGEMNVLDLRTQPLDLQLGFFERWWDLVGRGHSFDVLRAEAAFWQLLTEAGVTVKLDQHELVPLMEAGRISGVRTITGHHFARQFIDGTADMDLAAAAGARFTGGFESLGVEARMADTLIFRIENVDWVALRRGIREQGPDYAAETDHVAYGHFGGYPRAYEPLEEGVRLRGLNLGLQDDGSLLVNALLVHDVDPFDPANVALSIARAGREAKRIVRYLAAELPGFAAATYGGHAERLYVRETRHLDAECTLTVDDVLNNKVTGEDIAAGGYPLDVQPLTPEDHGFVFGAPDVYGVRLCHFVPVGVTALWVVGKAAGYDPLAASSARVVPFGMASAEGVGVAAATAVAHGLDPSAMAQDTALIREVRAVLRERGAVIPDVKPREAVGPVRHPAYGAFRDLLRLGLATGGYENDPRLDEAVPAEGYVALLGGILARSWGCATGGVALADAFAYTTELLTVGDAQSITTEATRLMEDCAPGAALRLPRPGIEFDAGDKNRQLTRGEMYILATILTHK